MIVDQSRRDPISSLGPEVRAMCIWCEIWALKRCVAYISVGITAVRSSGSLLSIIKYKNKPMRVQEKCEQSSPGSGNNQRSNNYGFRMDDEMAADADSHSIRSAMRDLHLRTIEQRPMVCATVI